MPTATTLTEDPTMTPLPYDEDTARRIWLGLRLLQDGHSRGWWTVLATDHTGTAHLVDIAGRGVLVSRDDTVWWAYGVADGWGLGTALRSWADTETVPELWTYEQAAAALGITPTGVRVGPARTGELYTIGLPDPTRTPPGIPPRYVFAAQIRARVAGATDADREAWWTIRASLPTQARLYHLPYPTRPAPDPDPLPVPRGATVLDRAMRALRIGHDHGWFEHVTLVAEDGAARWASVRVDVAGRRARARALIPLVEVPTWVRGVADRHGLGREVTYQPGMNVDLP